MPPNSISEHLFLTFLGHAPRPPSISMLRMLIVLHTMMKPRDKSLNCVPLFIYGLPH